MVAGLLLSVTTALAPVATTEGQRPPDPLVGAWSGQIQCGDETEGFTLRFEQRGSDSVSMFWTLPEANLRGIGPIALPRQGSEFSATFLYFAFSLRLTPDGRSMTGRLSFDGHDLPFALARGAQSPDSTLAPPGGELAEPAWTFNTGGAIWSSPAVADGVVYFGSNDGFVYALDTKSGHPLWRFKTGGPVMASPTPDGQYLYVLSDDGFLYRLERRSGKAVWQFDTHGGGVARTISGPGRAPYDRLASAAAVANGVVYVGSADNRLYAVDAESGREKWSFQTQGAVRSTPAIADGRIFFGSYDHYVYAVEAETGALLWKHDAIEPVVSSPLAANGAVYVGSRSSDFFAFDAATGRVNWKVFYWTSWVESSARMKDGVLYIGSSDYLSFLALDAATGKRVWKLYAAGWPWSTPAVGERFVYIGTVGQPGSASHQGAFLAVDRARGRVVWRHPMTARPGSSLYGASSSPAIGDGLVFVGGLDGIFYAFLLGG